MHVTVATNILISLASLVNQPPKGGEEPDDLIVVGHSLACTTYLKVDLSEAQKKSLAAAKAHSRGAVSTSPPISQ